MTFLYRTHVFFVLFSDISAKVEFERNVSDMMHGGCLYVVFWSGVDCNRSAEVFVRWLFPVPCPYQKLIKSLPKAYQKL